MRHGVGAVRAESGVSSAENSMANEEVAFGY